MQGVALGKGATSQPLQLKYFDTNNSPGLGDSGLKALLGAFITQKKLFEVNLNHCAIPARRAPSRPSGAVWKRVSPTPPMPGCHGASRHTRCPLTGASCAGGIGDEGGLEMVRYLPWVHPLKLLSMWGNDVSGEVRDAIEAWGMRVMAAVHFFPL